MDREIENKDEEKEMKEIDEEILKKQKEMIDWKEEVEYELTEKKIKNKLTQLRIELMNIEEEADNLANEKYLMKIRELLCICFKKYNKENNLFVSEEDIEEGMEIFICRENAID